MLIMQSADDHKFAAADHSASLELLAARLGLQIQQRRNGKALLTDHDGKDIQPWRESYPYPQLLRRKPYEAPGKPSRSSY